MVADFGGEEAAVVAAEAFGVHAPALMLVDAMTDVEHVAMVVVRGYPSYPPP